ncbi:hypothetical protein PV327_004970 [Microctonus hyperodae]|nr:hypothetical protein PV327_004970 [Microctonus hyperodae]
MSEQKRVPTQTLELSGSLVNATKKEKKGEKSKQLVPSFRFELSLDDKNEKGYSEFNYAHLLKSAEKKRGKEQKISDESAVNGLDPFDDDDDEKLRNMAKRFEAKYGTAPADKNRKKYDDDVDLGAGYDENDSFIDNTDAYDEVVPEGVTTAYGGFYINSGLLEFSVKPEEQNLSAHRNNNNNDDNSSESSEDEVEDSNGPDSKRRSRLLISSSEDEDIDEIVTEPLVKKVKLDENGEKKSADDVMIKKKKKVIGDQQYLDNSNRQKNIDDKRDSSMEVDRILDCQDDRKKLNCDVKMKSKKIDVRKFVKDVTVTINGNGNDEKKLIDSKKFVGKDSNIDDAIESVVNDGRIDDESSRDTIDSGKSRCVAGTSSECEDVDKMDIRLPENLPDDIRDIINKLKKAAECNKEGKIKFFDASVNSTLFSLEKKLRILDSSTVRSQVYAHLAHFLSCSKVTLANRAKKLCLQDVEGKMKEPMERLKTIIDDLMPSVIEKYNNDCQRVVEEKGVEASFSDRDSSDGNEKSTEKSKNPRKRFPWTSEARKLVYEIVTEWRQYFKMQKSRKESMETFVKTFVESKIVPLWPQGWMRVETLLKYANSEPA